MSETNETAIAIRPNASLSEAVIKEMAEQRILFEKFVKSQMFDKIDFGILPGTEKPSLWKPGAEKLLNIFQLGARIIDKNNVIDYKENIATFFYTIEVFHLATGRAIAQCEGVCSSQEKKYRERQEYEWVGTYPNKKKVTRGDPIPTKVGDVLNTLAKMAQKRAFVGVVIIATKASDFFNHDLSEDEEEFFENNPEATQNPVNPPIKEKSQTVKKESAIPEAKKNDVSDARVVLGAAINAERVRLKWSSDDVTKYVKENFGKETRELDLSCLQLLCETMKKTKAKEVNENK